MLQRHERYGVPRPASARCHVHERLAFNQPKSPHGALGLPGGPARPVLFGRGANTLEPAPRFVGDLVERLHFHDPVVVVAADPERHRRRRIVDEHRAHVGVGRHQVLHRLAGLGIEPHDAVGAASSRPRARRSCRSWLGTGTCTAAGCIRRGIFPSWCRTARPCWSRYSVTRMRSWSSICMRRARACAVGVGVPRHFRRSSHRSCRDGLR